MKKAKVVEIEVVPFDIRKNPNIDAKLEYSPYNYENIVGNCEAIGETLIIKIQDDDPNTFPLVERILDTNITSAWFCAIDCLAVGLCQPSVLFSSISVECVLNHDLRLEHLRLAEPNDWIDLNWRTLKSAGELGLPIESLLCAGEKLEKGAKIEFIVRRNKVAHGDLEGYYGLYPGSFDRQGFSADSFDIGYSKPTKEHALDQIARAKKFIVEWARQKPEIRIH